MRRAVRSLIIPSVTILCLSFATIANAQSDVTQPGDPAIASSGNSPGSEGVANAIDNTQAKYLNFDTRNPNNPPSGFVVSPSVGVTRVIGMTITSANDAPERDPSTILLEGSNDAAIGGWNDPTNTWVTIAGLTNIPAFTARFQKQTFFFDNFSPYRHYRWTVVAVATNNGCCMQVAEVELLGSTLPPDVTQPGDPAIASSGNSPGSEGVANAIDNTQAKYLNFDTRNPNNPPSGFVVSPSIGRSLVTGMTIQSANDAPERDPSTVLLEGSNDAAIGGWNDPTNTWEVVVGLTNIPPFAARFQTQTFLFDNYKPYRHYRWTVVNVATNNGCCMQVAEVELLGTGAPKDVTQPGDPAIASSGNSPGSEGVANAIDNTQAKYLNFDTRNPNNPPSGFIVSPSVGATVVIGMTIQSANDAPERDPSTVLLEGSNDAAIGGWNDPTNTWEFVTGLTNIPAFTARFQTQEFYFANKKSYRHYRWTVANVATNNGCCMQVAEVELLAATQSNPCGQAEFTLLPVNTPVLSGTPATFLAKVNGPWTVQWLSNGVPIPGANTLSYTTPPVTPPNDTIDYSCAIVGCQTSAVVRATIFSPSATKSIAVSFRGGGANGAPTDMNYPNDIAGIQLQAFWNNATNASGFSGDGLSMGPLMDSDNQATTISFDYQTGGTWGAGTGTDSATERMLNGLVGDQETFLPGTFHFNTVPAGNHSILIYAVSPPLQFQNVSFIVTGETSQTNYLRTLNSDEYKVAPGFYRGTSTDPNNPSVANFVRFDNVQPLGGAGGTITLDVQTLTPGVDRETGVNGLQLVLNTVAVPPPVITVQPQPTVAASNTTARLSVTATGTGLTYQWRKNGKNLLNAGHISGANTANLTISNFDPGEAGIYSVVVFDSSGNSVVSQNASVRLSTYNILDSLVAQWKLDETSGTTAANAIAGGRPGTVNGTATWGAGRIGNAFTFDGTSFLFVDNFTKASKQMAASAWVNLLTPTGSDIAVVRNDEGALDISGGAGRVVGQFELGLVYDINDGLMKPMGAIGLGPNVARATGTAAFTDGAWHHLAFTADGAQVRVYVDGQQAASTDYQGDINPPDVPWISIGARLVTDTNSVPPQVADPGFPNYMNGQLDDIGVWTRALTADEVLKVYQAGLQGQPLNTVVIPPPAPDLQITSVTITGGNVTVTWVGGGTLYTSSAIGTGAVWTTTGDSDGSYTAPIGAGNRFFRVQQ